MMKIFSEIKNLSEKESEQREIDLQGLSEELKEVTISKEAIFYRYCRKKEIGKEILDAYTAYNKKASKKEYKYIFSDDFKRYGALSELQGFQTVLMLVQDFDLDLKECKIDVEAMINSLFEELEDSETHQLVFGLAPYTVAEEFFKGGKRNIDTVTWFISAMLSVFRLHISGKYTLAGELKEKCINSYIDCIDYLNKSFISQAEQKDELFDVGWNFTDGCNEPSLYYVFAISEVLIDIYSTFNHCIVAYEVQDVTREIESVLKNTIKPAGYTDEGVLEEIKQKQAKIAEDNRQTLEEYNSDKEEIRREKELFTRVNGVSSREAPYQTLESNVKLSANDIWQIVKPSFTETFFSYDLKPVSFDTIDQGTSNDAIFNTIFIINIVVNAGLDEDIDDKINFFTFADSAEYKAALQEYDELRDALRITYDNAYQSYNELVKKHKEYKVDEFIVTLDENFADEKLFQVAKDIRKAHIRVFSLMPLLIKTKTLMSDFVIRYPQYDMQIYLEKILQSRLLDEKNEYRWIWEKDNYSSSSNYYFILALSSFFDYYEQFEKVFLENANKNEEDKKKIEQDYDKSLREHGGDIYKLQKENEAQRKQIGELNDKNNNLEQKLRDYENDPLTALKILIAGVLKEQIYEIIGHMFVSAAGNIENEAREKETDENIKSDLLKEGFKEFLLSLVARQIYESAKNSFDKRKGDVEEDIKKAIEIYIKQVVENKNSSFVKNNGFDRYTSILQDLDNMRNK